MSARNQGHVVGRLARDPHAFANRGGATKIVATVMADRSYRNRTTGQRDSDAVPVEAWVPGDRAGLCIWDYVGKGDAVAIDYAVRFSSYVDQRTGEIVYRTSLVVVEVVPLESKAVREQRRADRGRATVEPSPAEVESELDQARQN